MRHQRRRDLMTRSQRAVRWLQPGLVVKRWLLTSGLGLLMALLGAAVWADLKPIYWILETLSWLLSSLTTVLPREITGPLVLLIGSRPFALGAEPQLRLDSTGSRTRQGHRAGGCPAGQKPLEPRAPTSWPSAAEQAYRPC